MEQNFDSDKYKPLTLTTGFKRSLKNFLQQETFMDPQHVAKIKEGVAVWNEWREKNLNIEPNFSHADLSGLDLRGIDLRGAGLFKTNFSGSTLVGANLRQTRMVGTNFQDANLTAANVYGTSVWDVNLIGAKQSDLVITPPGHTTITVDDLEVAQLIYLLINNRKIRQVIDTITSKVVLILGSFQSDRKPILDMLRDELRLRNYLPVLFDFQGPENRDLTETVSTLAHLARFVIADLTSPKCIPHELYAIVPGIFVPVATIIRRGERPYAMFNDLLKYQSLLRPEEYIDEQDVRKRVLDVVISNTEAKRNQILVLPLPGI
jgi:hypothetical protein